MQDEPAMDNKRILYLGLELPPSLKGKNVVHCPLIRIAPVPHDSPDVADAFSRMNDYTHLLFTSGTAAEIFFSHATHYGINAESLANKEIIAVGKRTAEKAASFIPQKAKVAEQETAEGVCALLGRMDLDQAYLFWPRSSLSRPVIGNWLEQHRIRHASYRFYDTLPIILPSPPPLDQFDEIIFTSPSTIEAFLKNYPLLPTAVKMTCIGPVTQAHMEKCL